MNLENLRKDYETTFSRYEQFTREYYNLIKTNNPDTLTTTRNFKLNGTPLSTLANKTIAECNTACGSNPSCKGATFTYTNSAVAPTPTARGTCALQTGEVAVVPNANTYAIVAQSKMLLYNIQTTNSSLLTINTQIQTLLRNLNTRANTVSNSADLLKFQSSYQDLLRQRENIDTVLQEYDTFDSMYRDGVNRSTQSYYVYILLFIVTCVCIVLVIYPVVVTTSRNVNTLAMIQNIDVYAEENIYSIAVLCIGVPICYYLLKHTLNY